MKALILTVLLFSGTLLFGSTPSAPFYTPPKLSDDPSYDAGTYKKINVLIVNVEWDKTSVENALRDLALKSKSADPAHLGVRFVLKRRSGNDKVSLSIQNIPIYDLLGYLMEQTGLQMRVMKGEVDLSPISN